LPGGRPRIGYPHSLDAIVLQPLSSRSTVDGRHSGELPCLAAHPIACGESLTPVFRRALSFGSRS
jgi:hypothetical protein